MRHDNVAVGSVEIDSRGLNMSNEGVANSIKKKNVPHIEELSVETGKEVEHGALSNPCIISSLVHAGGGG